ncbi:hypothetical protein CITRIK5_20598 [Citricoccus sp. K5]|nr:hypothetical protein CITRIK5_20598 [Citricoccus sp. K5]
MPAEADAAGQIDWSVSVDANIARARQHATHTTRPDQDTRGRGESQETAAGHDRPLPGPISLRMGAAG